MAKKKTTKKKSTKKREVKKEESKNSGFSPFQTKEGKVKKKKKTNKEEVKTKKSDSEKQARNFLIILGVFILLVMGGIAFAYYHYNSPIDYKGVEFQREKFGDKNPLITYKTLIPLYNSTGEQEAVYQLWLRNNPKELDVEINGELISKKIIVLDIEGSFNCNGDGGIAFENLKQLYKVLGAKIFTENSTCDERYTYFNFKQGNKTEINQIDNKSCYEVYISDCEVLEATEKIIIETLVKTQDKKFSINNVKN